MFEICRAPGYRVSAYARHHELPLDLVLAHQLLDADDVPLKNDPESIIQAVADEYRVSVSELKGPPVPAVLCIPARWPCF